jgi:hypothetical protein
MKMRNRVVEWLSMYKPITKREFLEARHELYMLVKAVKEIEAMNRTDVSYIINKIEKQLDGDYNKDEEKNDKPGLEFQ